MAPTRCAASASPWRRRWSSRPSDPPWLCRAQRLSMRNVRVRAHAQCRQFPSSQHETKKSLPSSPTQADALAFCDAQISCSSSSGLTFESAGTNTGSTECISSLGLARVGLRRKLDAYYVAGQERSMLRKSKTAATDMVEM